MSVIKETPLQLRFLDSTYCKIRICKEHNMHFLPAIFSLLPKSNLGRSVFSIHSFKRTKIFELTEWYMQNKVKSIAEEHTLEE